jgi:hypothetical protein
MQSFFNRRHVRTQGVAVKPDAATVAPPKLSKAARRKVAQLQRDKAARAQRAGVLAALSDTAIPADQVSFDAHCRQLDRCDVCPRLLRSVGVQAAWSCGSQLRFADACASAAQAALLRGTALRGQRPTKRQRLRRELLAQRLGLALQVGGRDTPSLCFLRSCMGACLVMCCWISGTCSLVGRSTRPTAAAQACSVRYVHNSPASIAARHRRGTLMGRGWRWTGGCPRRRASQMRQMSQNPQLASTCCSAMADSSQQMRHLQAATGRTETAAAQKTRKRCLTAAGECDRGMQVQTYSHSCTWAVLQDLARMIMSWYRRATTACCAAVRRRPCRPPSSRGSCRARSSARRWQPCGRSWA